MTNITLQSATKPAEQIYGAFKVFSQSKIQFLFSQTRGWHTTHMFLLLQANSLGALELEIRDAEYRVLVLALDRLVAPLPPLGLDLDAQGLRLGARDGGAALEQALVEVGGALEGVVARAQAGGAVQAQHVAREDAGHLEGQADPVARLHQVRAPPDVRRDVVARLRLEQGQQLADGLGGLGRQRRRRLGLLGVQRLRDSAVALLRLQVARLGDEGVLGGRGRLGDGVAGYRAGRCCRR